jgi:hypothetical protein
VNTQYSRLLHGDAAVATSVHQFLGPMLVPVRYAMHGVRWKDPNTNGATDSAPKIRPARVTTRTREIHVSLSATHQYCIRQFLSLCMHGCVVFLS